MAFLFKPHSKRIEEQPSTASPHRLGSAVCQVRNFTFHQHMEILGSFYTAFASSLAHLGRAQLLTCLKERWLHQVGGVQEVKAGFMRAGCTAGAPCPHVHTAERRKSEPWRAGPRPGGACCLPRSGRHVSTRALGWAAATLCVCATRGLAAVPSRLKAFGIARPPCLHGAFHKSVLNYSLALAWHPSFSKGRQMNERERE